MIAPGKYRQRSYDNLKTGKSNVHQSNDELTKQTHLIKLNNDENSDLNIEMKRLPIQSSDTEQTQKSTEYNYRYSKLKRNKVFDRISSSSSTSLSSSLSSLTSINSQPQSTETQFKLIPVQYRVYAPQKQYQMKQAHTEYVYSVDKTNEIDENDTIKRYVDVKAS